MSPDARRGRSTEELLEMAAQTYGRGEAAGQHGAGAFNLGFVLERQGDLDAAEEAYARADELGHPAAAGKLGMLLERRGDLRGAEAALRRAADRGDREGSHHLARLLEDRGDVEEADRLREAVAARGGVGSSSKKRGPSFVAIGIAGTLVIAAIAFLTYSKRVPFLPRYRIDAVFQSSNQLRPASPVRIAGVDVGKVVGFKDGPGSTQIVKLEIKKEGRPIHTDATAKIRPKFFLEGAFYVELQPGSPSAPEMDGGGTIPLSHTAIPVQFSQVLSALTRPIRDELRRTIFGLADTLDKGGAEAFGRAMTPLAPAMRDLSLVAQAMRGTEPHDLSDFVRSLSRVTAAFGRNDDELAGLVTGLNRTMGALAAEKVGLRASLREIDRVLRDAPPALTELDRALPSLEQFAAAARPGLRVAPPVLRRTDAVLRQLRALVRPRQLPEFLANLRPGLIALPGFSRSLRTLFPVVTPVTDCVRDRAIPVLNSTLDDGRLSSGRPVWQDLAHAAAGLTGATQTFDANGTGVRYLTGFGTQSVVLGGLSGRASSPILGTRPRWLGPGVENPYRPDRPCREQAPPDLTARTGGGLAATTSRPAPPTAPSRLTRAGLRGLLERVEREGTPATRKSGR